MRSKCKFILELVGGRKLAEVQGYSYHTCLERAVAKAGITDKEDYRAKSLTNSFQESPLI